MRRVKRYTIRKSSGCDRQRDQREAPARVEHDPHDADEREDAGDDAQHRRGDEVLDALDVARHAADQVAGSLLIVVGQRQAMDVVIHRAPQVVHDPLADVGGEIALQVGAGGTGDRDGRHRRHREVEDGEVAAADPAHDPDHPTRHRLGRERVVEHDLDRPGFEQVGRGHAAHCDERHRHRLPVGSQKVDDAERPGLVHDRRRCGRASIQCRRCKARATSGPRSRRGKTSPSRESPTVEQALCRKYDGRRRASSAATRSGRSHGSCTK